MERKLKIGDLVKAEYSKSIGIIVSFEKYNEKNKEWAKGDKSLDICVVLVGKEILYFPERNLKKYIKKLVIK